MNPALPRPSALGALPNRRGVALPLALFVLVIAATMITAVFYVARLEQRMGNNSLATARAFEAAEGGVAATLANWDHLTYNGLANDSTLTLPTTDIGGSAVYTTSIRRLSSTLFLIRAEGEFLTGGRVVTRRQVARLVRTDPAGINPQAAITSRVGLTVSGSPPPPTVSGRDTIPGGWGAVCPAPGPMAPGIRDSTGVVTTSGACSGASCISGTPPIQTDPAVTSAVFTNFGSEDFATLSANADKTASGSPIPAASTVAGPPVRCQYSDPNNWGDPLNPSGVCGGYFPIIYAPGDVTLAGGWGQGILLVQGNLTLSGGEFYGVAIVQGNVTASGSHIIGGLMINNVAAGPTVVTGNAAVTFSRCAVNRATRASSLVKALSERSWAQLY